MDRRGGVRSGIGLFRAAARRSRSVGDARPGREFHVTTSKLRDALADRAYDWGVVCAQCGNGAPSLESLRSTGVRPGVGSSGVNDRARALHAVKNFARGTEAENLHGALFATAHGGRV